MNEIILIFLTHESFFELFVLLITAIKVTNKIVIEIVTLRK